jgi:hypothetical protein
MHVYWADQWTIEATEDLDHASGSTHGFRRYDETGLHAHIEHYTTLWWNKVLSEQNARWEATLHMYKLVSLPPAAATAQMRMRGRAWRGPAPAARRPGAVVQPRPGLYGRVGQARARVLTTDWCLLRHSIIRSAVEMQGAWLDSAGNLIQESDAAVLEHLEAFWRDGVGTGNWQARAQESAQNATPWSAAFVSWVVRNAGATTAMGFDFSGRHMDYIAEALRNRMRNDQDRPFWFFGIGEQAAHPLLPGDIVCMNRSFNGQLTTHSLEGLRRRFWGDDGENANADTTGAAHCDVAIGYQTDSNGQRFIEVIGGNRGHHSGPNAHTVGSALLEVDAAGQLTNPGAHNIFGFVKLIECEQVM